MSKRKLLKRLAKILVVIAALIGVGVAIALYVMNQKDKEHARFFNTGKSVNSFLSDYKRGVEEALKKKDISEITRFYSDHYNSPARGRWAMRPAPDESDVSVLKVVAEGREDYDKAALAEEVAGYLSTIASVQNTWCKVDMIEQIDPDRRVVLRVKYLLDGTDPQGALFQDRHFYRWTLVNEAAEPGAFDWKIVRDELVEGLRVAGDGEGFREVTPASVGIDFKHSRDPKLDASRYSARMKFDIIEHGSGGVSAVDYDNDGRQDIFFPDGVRSRLYRNVTDPATGEVKFVDVTTQAGLDGLDQANAGIFADVDNDGYQDLFVARYLAPNKFFHNNGDGTFTDRSREMGLDLKTTSTTAVFLDYDLDGYPDLYVGAY